MPEDLLCYLQFFDTAKNGVGVQPVQDLVIKALEWYCWNSPSSIALFKQYPSGDANGRECELDWVRDLLQTG